jgi:signal transduction histidine kinase
VSRRLVDVAAVGAAAVAALFVAGDAEETGRLTDEALFWGLLLAGVGCLVLLWRRRWPVAVALVIAPMLALTETVVGAVLIAVYTVATRRRWPATVAVAGLAALAYVPYSVLRPDPQVPVAANNAINVALIAIAVAVGVGMRSRRDTIDALRERAARAEAEADLRAARLRGLERERIAREMHDALAHRISLVSLYAGALAIRPDLSAEEVARTATTIRDSAHLALEDLREILGLLRSGTDAELRVPPGLGELDALVAESRAAGTDLTVDDRLPDGPVPEPVDRTAFRVVQEGLTNARKHAAGVPVRLCLARADGGLRIRLSNPLGPADATAIPGARSGLVGLGERVEVLGGRLRHGVRRGPAGEMAFVLEAWLPWPT